MAEDTMHAAQKRFETTTSKLSHDYVEPAMDSVKEVIADRPMSSVVTVFGAGFAVGVLIGMSLAGSSPRRRQSTTERLGEQVLDAMSRVLPESLAKQIHR